MSDMPTGSHSIKAYVVFEDGVRDIGRTSPFDIFAVYFQNEGCPSDVEKAWTEIEEKVKSTPTMVFSVIGDSESFVPRPWAKSVFQTALIEAAKSGGDTWILYRGYDYGVSSVVRDAYQKYGDTEFRANRNDVPIDDSERQVKLINMAGQTASSKMSQESSKVNKVGDVTEENMEEDSTSQDTKNSKGDVS